MAFLGANRFGKLFSGLGSLSGRAYNAGKYGVDKALSSRMAMYGTMAAGAGLYAGTRNSNNSLVRGVGNLGLMAAGGIGFGGAYRGMMGSTMGAGARTAASIGALGAQKTRAFYRLGRMRGSQWAASRM